MVLEESYYTFTPDLTLHVPKKDVKFGVIRDLLTVYVLKVHDVQLPI